MLLNIFLLCTGIATLFSIKDWRRGIYLMILIGIVKDPVRKMIPGAPAYLALATVPVWAGILIGAFIENPGLWHDFRNSYRKLTTAIIIFLVSLLPAALKSATYGTGSWQVTLIGFFSYSSLIFGLFIGYIYPKYKEDIKKILIFYCIVNAIMLIGTPLEYLGVAKGWDALGTDALKGKWVHYGVYGYVIHLVSGFYRSPDVMGWHACTMSMLAIMMALQSSVKQRYFWVIIAGWGLMGGILCGRRKMIFMLPAFASILCLLYWNLPKRIKFSTLLAVILISSSTGVLIYHKMGPSTAIEKYYMQDPRVVFGRVEAHGYRSLITTYRQSGIFGEGLGTATQGIHHLNVTKPRTWQEGGLGRILVELGIPGFLCFLFLGFALVTTMWRLVAKQIDPSSTEFILRAGLISLIAANAVSFVVSHQIYGDPTIVCFFSVLIGFVLSKTQISEPVIEEPIGEPEQRRDTYMPQRIGSRTTNIRPLNPYRRFYKTSLNSENRSQRTPVRSSGPTGQADVRRQRTPG